MLATQARQLNTMRADGLLGLSPSGSELILSDLKKHGQIQNRVFSFSLDQNIFTLGGYDMQRFAAERAELIWLPDTLDDDDPDYVHWSVDLISFEVNGFSFESKSGQAIIDTGTSYMRVPASDFSRIKTVLERRENGEIRNCTVDNENGAYSCYCGFTESYKDFPLIKIQLADHENSTYHDFELTPEDYMEKLGLWCNFKL